MICSRHERPYSTKLHNILLEHITHCFNLIALTMIHISD
jgi:hypothetical protein